MPVSPTMRATLELAAERIISILDQLDQDPDLEDGGDAEPSLGGPEGDGSRCAAETGSLRRGAPSQRTRSLLG